MSQDVGVQVPPPVPFLGFAQFQIKFKMSEVQIKNVLDGELKKTYEIIIPNDLVEGKINHVVYDAQKNYGQKGFRRGKVPASVIKDQYSKSIMMQESEKIINETIGKIVEDGDLKLALRPNLDLKDFKEKEDIKCSLVLELFPEVPTIEIEKIKITKIAAKIADNEIQDELDRLLKTVANWNEKDGKAKKGNAVNIDYVGKIDDVEFEGGSAKDHQLELGSKSFIDDFEDQLIGKRKGDEVKVKVRFPKEYHNDKFADKKAVFQVKINSVLEVEMPETTDGFIKEKFKVDNLAKLKEKAENDLRGRNEIISENIFKKEAIDFLNKKYDFDITEGLIEEELKKAWDKIEEELKTNPDKFKNDKEKRKAKDSQREKSTKHIRTGIIMSDLIKKNNIAVTDEDIDQELDKRCAQFPGQEELFKNYYKSNPQMLDSIKGPLLEKKIMDLILAKAVVKHKNYSIKDLEKEYKKVYKD
ncbi:trigger factor [Flavobacteriaceae bacterium]|nr:trigger factor [Flavobacteriaceae bacterium]